MSITEAGRHCDLCCKNVIDFSSFSKEAIINYFVNNLGNDTCGRMRTSQFEKIRIIIDQNLLEHRISYWKKFLIVLLVIFGYELFGAEFAFSQTVQIDTIQKEKVAQKANDSLNKKPHVEDSISMVPTTTFDSITEIKEHIEFIDTTSENRDISLYSLKNHFKLDLSKIEISFPIEQSIMGFFVPEPVDIFETIPINIFSPNIFKTKAESNAEVELISQNELVRSNQHNKTPQKERKNTEKWSFILPEEVRKKKLKANMPI